MLATLQGLCALGQAAGIAVYPRLELGCSPDRRDPVGLRRKAAPQVRQFDHCNRADRIIRRHAGRQSLPAGAESTGMQPSRIEPVVHARVAYGDRVSIAAIGVAARLGVGQAASLRHIAISLALAPDIGELETEIGGLLAIEMEDQRLIVLQAVIAAFDRAPTRGAVADMGVAFTGST